MANIDNLFKIMAEKRISQKELAVAINASTGNVSDWKKGRSFPSAQKLDEAATFLDCSVDYLLGRTDTPNGTSIRAGDINGNNNSLTDSNNININNKKSADNIYEKFMAIFNNLPFEEQLEIMNIAVEKSKNKE